MTAKDLAANKTRTASFRISPSLQEALRRAARKKKIGISEAMRRALVAWLK